MYKAAQGGPPLVITPFCAPNGEPTFAASVNGIAIYLDNWAIKALAKGDTTLRQRFVVALRNGADILFSIAHAIEILGPQGASSVAFKTFLNEVGSHWYPLEFNVFKVMEREAAGMPPDKCCVDEELLRAYFTNRTSGHTPGSGLVIDLSEQFFKLGTFVDWLAPRRDYFRQKNEELDNILHDRMGLLRAKFKQDPGRLDKDQPQPKFHPTRAATFACVGLMRDLISDRGYQIKKGDGIDFFHAVMASAFSTFATLDKQWKRRVENLPKPNGSPRIYYEPELGEMVHDIEAALGQLKEPGKASVDIMAR